MEEDTEKDWLQKGIEERNKIEHERVAIGRNRKILHESALLSRIQNKQVETEKKTLYRFELSPISKNFGFSQIDSIPDVGLTVNCGNRSFSIEAKEDGIYLCFNLASRRLLVEGASELGLKLNPQSVSDKQIHEWFGRIVSGQ